MSLTFTAEIVNHVGFFKAGKPSAIEDAVDTLIDKVTKRTRGRCYLTLTLAEPHRPRSTGRRSQNNRFYGHCEDIAEQVYPDLPPIIGKQRVHDGMLRMSVSEGYPTYLDLNGVEIPLPSAEASIEQMNVVTKTLQRFADIHNFWLHEYVKKGPHKGEVYKSIGGRSYEEMQRYQGDSK